MNLRYTFTRSALVALLLLGGCVPIPDRDEIFDPDEDGVPYGEDCDNLDASVYPGAPEIAYNDIDNDCDPSTPDDDLDGDGYPLADDCDDSTASIAPSHDDLAQDRVDQNCDGVDGTDLDGDAEASVATGGPDCDDEDTGVNTGSQETCDGRDEDCDGEIDEDAADEVVFYVDDDGDGYGDADAVVMACDDEEVEEEGLSLVAGDCDDADPDIHPEAMEVCEDLDVDEDCDGRADDYDESVDESTMTTWYTDGDRDGFGDTTDAGELACDASDGRVASADDCDDGDEAVSPGAREVCDEADVDEDCDGRADDADEDVDESTMTTWYTDEDGDGYGDETDTGVKACDAPDGYDDDNTDCDDGGEAVSPGATEIPGDELDQNCDTDEQCYADADNDGYRTDTTVISSDTDCDDTGEAISSESTGDCDDTDKDINPHATEIAGDEIDSDCDGQELCYVDDDDDGYRLTTTTTSLDEDCDDNGEAISSESTGDCDDTDEDIHPGATEIAGDEVDQDCDYDELCYVDTDGDGYHTGSTVTSSDTDCRDSGEAPSSKTEVDCDDTSDTVYPGADEVCEDSVVNDCDESGADAMDECMPSGTISLSAADATLLGEEKDDIAGFALAGGGDLTGDGVDDLLVGAPGDDSGAIYGGALYVLSGALSGLTSASTPDIQIVGEELNDYVGRALEAGDLDGDGAADLIAGVPYRGSTVSTARRGGAFVFWGPLTASTSVDSADLTLTATTTYGYAGTAVQGSEDLNGDEVADLLIGAPSTSSRGAGAAYLVFGPASGSISLETEALAFTGLSLGDYAGQAVCSGDLSGDGAADLVVGAYGVDSGSGSASGAVYILEGPLSASASLADADAALVGYGNLYAGYSLAGGQDLDGDGTADLLIGGKNAESGSVFLVHGPVDGSAELSTIPDVLSGEASGDSFGHAVDLAGDLDLDGIEDLIVGAPGEDTGGTSAGAAYLFFGPVSGTVSAADARAKWSGANGSDQAGYSVARAGDMDSDGFPDLAIGAYGLDLDTTMTNAGGVYLLYGWSY